MRRRGSQITIILLFLAGVWASYTSCGQARLGGSNLSGTISGNPMTPGAGGGTGSGGSGPDPVTVAVCDKLQQTYTNLSDTDCYNGVSYGSDDHVYSSTSYSGSSNDGSGTTIHEFTATSAQNAIASCVSQISALDPNAPVVRAAYNPASSEPFEYVTSMIPRSTECCLALNAITGQSLCSTH